MSADTITKLIALAGSDNPTEARNAAYQACKLLRDGRYRILDPEPDNARVAEEIVNVVSEIPIGLCAICRDLIRSGQSFVRAGPLMAHALCVPARDG